MKLAKQIPMIAISGHEGGHTYPQEKNGQIAAFMKALPPLP